METLGQFVGEIKGARETNQGTDLIFHIPDRLVADKVVKYNWCGKVEGLLYLDDKRRLSPKQMRKIYAILMDISKATGHTVHYLKDWFKYAMIYQYENIEEYFSLSPRSPRAATKEIAREMITMLIDFCFRENIGTLDTMLERTDDIDTYLYLCIKHKKCCICNKKADIHHVEAVGMGRNRNKIDDTDNLKMALCREHHTESHAIGQKTFADKYKVYGIKVEEGKFKDWYRL